ncbi:MAG: hypothetical protein ACREBI_04325 [Nitrosotalea sp.]
MAAFWSATLIIKDSWSIVNTGEFTVAAGVDEVVCTAATPPAGRPIVGGVDVTVMILFAVTVFVPSVACTVIE